MVESQLARIASDLRELAGERTPAYRTRALVEAVFPGTLVTGGHLPDGIDEMVTRTTDGPLIVYRRSLPGPEQRLVIAHALAHLVFDDDRPGVPEIEARADAFAVELLAPLAAVRSLVTRWPCRDADDHELYLDHVDEIASRFAVPAHVIDSQIRRLRQTTDL